MLKWKNALDRKKNQVLRRLIVFPFATVDVLELSKDQASIFQGTASLHLSPSILMLTAGIEWMQIPEILIITNFCRNIRFANSIMIRRCGEGKKFFRCMFLDQKLLAAA